MSERSTQVKLEAAAVSDRGLSENRPLNEDSYLSNEEFRIFAVADGVGGAEAGEVASQTAIEVLEEAFRHQKEGDDVEDLLEIAIQRANDSIFRMSREHAKFKMMATTIVALHVDGLRATVGHVGDSRLYRITPDGAIRRETEDHSVVEEEVRAGRMTPEQAKNHPSRNVISRAVGSEADVEVDLKTFEVDGGTTFLICTDGITRHIPDPELGAIVSGARNLQTACEELKRLCFERGAQDNLTAVLVRVGGADEDADGFDEERTLVIERKATAPVSAQSASAEQGVSSSYDSSYDSPFEYARRADAPAQASEDEVDTHERLPAVNASHQSRNNGARRSGGAAGRFLAVLFLLLLFSAAAFYGGMIFEQRRAQAGETATASPSPSPVAATSSGAVAAGAYEVERSRVDSAPVTEAGRMQAELSAQPSNADDPKFLYLYGRALMLSGRPQEAAAHFEKSIGKIQETPSSANARLIIDARLATAAAHLQSNNVERAREAVDALNQIFQGAAGAPPLQQPGASASPPPSPSPF